MIQNQQEVFQESLARRPETYTVSLNTTRNNYDEKGNPLCCCTDSTFLEVEVGSLEGPGITLCMLSPNTAMTINNPFGSGWATNYYSPTLIELAAAP